MKRQVITLLAILLLGAHVAPTQQLRTVEVHTPKGVLRGGITADNQVRFFEGIPFAEPPVGPLRWRAPQPVKAWTGVRNATEFGPRCTQALIFSDMVFRDNGPSEDCLYLNVWAPESAFTGKASEKVKLPVMFWIYGGGFMAGGSSEPRQDGGNLAKKGVVVVSFNYRLGIFGFFVHPGAARESEHNSVGNYGVLDQLAALQWVHDNIALFGGAPDNVTIFGESAGSLSVSGMCASPLAKGLFRRAIGESGAFFRAGIGPRPRAQAEEADTKFAQAAFGTTSLDKLRTLPTEQVLEAARKEKGLRFIPDVDGWFLPESVEAIYAAGKQNRVALLAGWNTDEGNFRGFFRGQAPTPEKFAELARERYGDKAETFLKLYPASTEAEAKRSAGDIAGDNFIAYGTWKWIEQHTKTPGVPVYRYHFEQNLPLPEPAAPHAAEIEYVFMTLPSKNLPWRPEDRQVSELLASYWTNFAKTGDPNGPGLPLWPIYRAQDGYQVMHLSAANSKAAPDDRRERYLFLDSLGNSPSAPMGP
jgi:para-nitrobenzyl esterase